MTSTVIRNVGRLVTNDEEHGDLSGAALVFDGATIAWLGRMASLPAGSAGVELDAMGGCVLPGFVDSHAHLVFAGDRASDFAAMARGEPYRPDGILSTVAATRDAPTEHLEALAAARRHEALRAGTTTMESKSGYGLTVSDELRSCEIAERVTDAATFLGAHIVPPEYADRPDDYVELVVTAMLAACAPHVRFVDVFCERGAFDEDQARAVLVAARTAGLACKVHANQLGAGPGVQLAVEMGAASADHCTFLTDRDRDALAGSSTVATLLPITEFQTRSSHADGRSLLDAGATVAIASNCNPGSGYSSSMPLAIALAVRQNGLTVAEAVRAATLGGAAALGRTDVGTLRVGAAADVVVLAAPHEDHLAYRPGMDLVAAVFKGGHRVR